MPKMITKIGKVLAILGGGIAVGYLKCLSDVKNRYGENIEDEYITVKPIKGMSVGIDNRPEETEES